MSKNDWKYNFKLETSKLPSSLLATFVKLTTYSGVFSHFFVLQLVFSYKIHIQKKRMNETASN